MSVQSDSSLVRYFGNGSTVTPYAVPFYFFEPVDLRVVVTTEAGVETTLALGTDYVVAGAGNEAGGSITTTVAVPVTSRVTIFRQIALTQSTVYEENSDFPAKSHERALDRVTMAAQQNARAVDRSLKVRESDGVKSEIATVANSIIGFGGDSQPRTFTPAQLAVWLNLTQQIFGQGTKTWLTNADRAAAVPDFLGQVGVQLDDASLWVANGPAMGSWTNPIPGIVDGSITSEKLAAGAVSTLRLADGALSADAAGRAKMADAFITLAKLGAGIFTADATGREKFGSGFIDSSLCASGLWNAIAPSGAVLQTVFAETTASSTTGAAISFSSAAPLRSGATIVTATITPASASNSLLIRSVLNYYVPYQHIAVSAVFRNSSNTAISSAFGYSPDSAIVSQLVTATKAPAATTSTVTITLNVGSGSGSTVSINGDGSARMGGTCSTNLTIQEIKA